MANVGLIVGRVYSPGGGFTAPGVRVVMSALVGHDGTAIGYSAGSARKYIEAITDKKGEFAIRFVWSGADIGSALLFATATLTAYNDDRSGQTISVVSPKFQRLALFKNVKALLNTTSASFDGVRETAEFAVELWAALNEVDIYPVWKSQSLWTSESWAMVGGLEMTLGK